MRGRFDRGLALMRQRPHVMPVRDTDAVLRRQQALAERIASSMADCEYSPGYWQTYFDFALREIQQFDKEFTSQKVGSR